MKIGVDLKVSSSSSAPSPPSNEFMSLSNKPPQFYFSDGIWEAKKQRKRKIKEKSNHTYPCSSPSCISTICCALDMRNMQRVHGRKRKREKFPFYNTVSIWHCYVYTTCIEWMWMRWGTIEGGWKNEMTYHVWVLHNISFSWRRPYLWSSNLSCGYSHFLMVS